MKTKIFFLFLLLSIFTFVLIAQASDPYWDGYDDAQNGYWQRSDDREYLVGYEHGTNGDDEKEEQQEITPPAPPAKHAVKKRSKETTLVVKANPLGGYDSMGEINGKAVHFIIDTGATYVSLSKATADKLRLKYSKTKPIRMQTASGQDRSYLTKIRTISIGDIVLHDVPAAISTHDYPEHPLLGMSFLGQLDISQRGNQMSLRKRKLSEPTPPTPCHHGQEGLQMPQDPMTQQRRIWVLHWILPTLHEWNQSTPKSVPLHRVE